MTTLTCIFALPLFAAIALAFVPRNFAVVMRAVAVAVTFVMMLLAVRMFCRFDAAREGYQFVSTIPGLGAKSLGIACKLGVDGLNVGLILMGAIVAFAAACCSFEIKSREKEFYILLLVMTGGILGAFASLDLFFFYFFHELALVPTFIMIGVWGRGERKNYATFQVTLYLSIGALLALIGLIALYLQVPLAQRTFDIPTLTKFFHENPMALASQNFIFPLLLFGFGILVSLWPFHSWAALGYGSAPAPTAMLHAGVLKKFGLYGLIRVALPLMPQAAQHWMQVVAWLCLGNVLYIGWVAMRQRDLNLLIGNSSVAHMGFVFLGIASLNLIGVTGAVIIMVAHGFLAALTFGLSGYIYQQTGTLEISRLGGLARKLRFIGAVFTMAALAGCGLPGFANFVGEVTVFFGAWQVPALRVVTVLAVWGALIVGSVYMLRAVRAALHGPMPETWANVADANWWRKLPYALLLASLLVFGFFPRLLTDKITPVADRIVSRVASQALPVNERRVAFQDMGEAPVSQTNEKVLKFKTAEEAEIAVSAISEGEPRQFPPKPVRVQIEMPYFFIGGEVTKGGSFSLTDGLTLSKAINLAGGLTDFGNGRNVIVRRRNGETLTIDCFEARTNSDRDLSIQAHDNIYVTKKPFLPGTGSN